VEDRDAPSFPIYLFVLRTAKSIARIFMLILIRLEEVQSISAQFQITPITLGGGTVLVRRQIRTATRSAPATLGPVPCQQQM
jgi:hypothetical protein